MRSMPVKSSKCICILLVVCSTMCMGLDCSPSRWFGDNFSLNVVVPMGLGGTPGVLNPFGIVQALVNAQLDVDGDSSGSDSPGASPAPAPTFDPAVTAVLN